MIFENITEYSLQKLMGRAKALVWISDLLSELYYIRWLFFCLWCTKLSSIGLYIICFFLILFVYLFLLFLYFKYNYIFSFIIFNCFYFYYSLILLFLLTFNLFIYLFIHLFVYLFIYFSGFLVLPCIPFLFYKDYCLIITKKQTSNVQNFKFFIFMSFLIIIPK